MSIRSDVAIVLTKEIAEEIKKEEKLQELFEITSDQVESEEQVMLVYAFIKFYPQYIDNVFGQLFLFLEDKEDDYYILEICHDNDSIEEYGSLDNDFDLGYRMELTYQF